MTFTYYFQEIGFYSTIYDCAKVFENTWLTVKLKNAYMRLTTVHSNVCVKIFLGDKKYSTIG